ncbi:unnamed protein product [Schistosoma mattheei]|uniref:Uncharacterized protein n=1 Tax=Schistosoma mattheei TaxID=31246 RepID=A0A183PR32_9TREM|nr:unnamed protein product [Schistosoma mattheei]
MVVGGSQQETLNLGFVLFGTRQQDVPVILTELTLDSVSPSFTVRDVTIGPRVSCRLPPITILFQLNAHNVESPRLVTILQLGR